MMKKHILLIIIITLILIYLSFMIVKPLLIAILSSFILTFVFFPVYSKLNKKINSRNLCSLLTILVILLLIITPAVFITNALAKESLIFYNKVKGEDFSAIISKYIEPNFQEYINNIIKGSILYIIKVTSNFVLSIPNIALNFFVTIFLTYYLLKESETFLETAKKYMPFKETVKQEIFERFRKITNAIVFGTILTAIIQGILGTIGFVIFDIPSPVLWGFIMAFASLIPIAGTALVWLPAGIIQLFQQDYFSGFGILLYGALIVGTIDNIIKPRLVGRKAKVHPAVVLIGILGGIKLIGFIGFIIGPLILATAIELVKVETRSARIKQEL